MYLTENERQKLISYIKDRLTEKRFIHTLGTEKMAIRLAELSGEDVSKAQTAALLHDSCKCLSLTERESLLKKYGLSSKASDELGVDIIHGQIASCAVRDELGITDEDVLNAIAYHTTGRPNMSRLEKIIYSADVVEENRSYDVIDFLRESVYKDINRGTYIVMNHVLQYLLKNNLPVYGKTVDAYNYLLKEQKKNSEV